MALIGNQNSVGNAGNKGRSGFDRTLANEVRMMSLKKIKRLLEIPDTERSAWETELYKAILIKLAGTILPRLNEHTGEDGGPISINKVMTDDDLSNVISLYERNKQRTDSKSDIPA